MATRRELIAAIGQRYLGSNRSEREAILDELVSVTGYHRKHAIRVLRSTERPPRRRSAPRIYDVAVADALIILWETADRVCGKRLKALLPTLIDAMERFGHLALAGEVRAKLVSISAATIDRMLATARQPTAEGRRRRSGVGSAIRKSVPVRTFADWKDPPPGYFEMDLVEHCGGDKRGGSFVHTLVLTDIATGWTECVSLPLREQTLIVEALAKVRADLPFPMLGLDTDNDSAFMNETLQTYCRENRLEWTRSRAYKKNDQAWVEQKNGAVVRRLLGYGRLSGVEATAAVGALYASARLFINFFQPCFKLKSKQRDGALVRKQYHAPRTPFEQVLANDAIDTAAKARLRQQFVTLDPVMLLKRIRDAQNVVTGFANRETVESDQRAAGGLALFLRGLGSAWKGGEIRPTHRKRRAAVRWWRTRADPFAHSWSLVEDWLGAEPNVTAKELFARLRQAMPEAFPANAQLRTLQRRVQAWRAEHARRLIFGAVDAHAIGSESLDATAGCSDALVRADVS
jgi:hypothetical protein